MNPLWSHQGSACPPDVLNVIIVYTGFGWPSVYWMHTNQGPVQPCLEWGHGGWGGWGHGQWLFMFLGLCTGHAVGNHHPDILAATECILLLLNSHKNTKGIISMEKMLKPCEERGKELGRKEHFGGKPFVSREQWRKALALWPVRHTVFSNHSQCSLHLLMTAHGKYSSLVTLCL